MTKMAMTDGTKKKLQSQLYIPKVKLAEIRHTVLKVLSTIFAILCILQQFVAGCVNKFALVNDEFVPPTVRYFDSTLISYPGGKKNGCFSLKEPDRKSVV